MKHRIIFNVHIKAGRERDFLEAYQPIRRLIAAGQRGLIAEQVCQSIDDPQRFTITSEWEDLEAFQEWKRAPLIASLRCRCAIAGTRRSC